MSPLSHNVTSYGVEVGFNQEAIDRSAPALGSAKLLRKKRILEQFVEDLVGRDTGLYCLSEDGCRGRSHCLGGPRSEPIRDSKQNERRRKCGVYHPDEWVEEAKPAATKELEVTKKDLLVGWICDNHRSFGCPLSLVSDRTAADRQFSQGLGDIGGLLSWRVDFESKRRRDSQVE